MTLPSVVDRQPEFEARCLEIEGIARLADNGLEPVDLNGGDHAELIGLADMDETLEQRRRQLADGAKETVVAGARSQAAEIVLQEIRIARRDEAHGYRIAVARAQHVGMLPEIIETQGGHGRAPGISECESRRPSSEAAPAIAAPQARQNGLSTS